MQRKHTLWITVALLLATAAAGAQGVRSGAGDRLEQALPEGAAVAALEPVGAVDAWGRIVAVDLESEPLIGLEGWLHGLDPWSTYTLLLDGTAVTDVITNRFGDAHFAALVASQDGRSDLDDPTPGVDARGALDLETATVVDESLAAVLEGDFVPAGGGGGSPVVYEDRAVLRDVSGTGARGMARVERREDGFQLFETRATGLLPDEVYHVVVDGFLAAVVTADPVGQAAVRLVAPAESNPLPPELIPVDNLRQVEWTGADGLPVLAGSFAGDTPQPVQLFGTVEAVAADSFELRLRRDPDLLITVMVTEETAWGGELAGIADLETGMAVMVEGERVAESTVQAWFVADETEPPPPPVAIDGFVATVAESSFVVAFDPGAADGITVTVDDSTEWVGSVTGIGELEPGMWVHVDGEHVGDRVIHALVVIAEDEPPPPPVHLLGVVASVAGSSFALESDDQPGQVVTVWVDADTSWGGSLTGIDDVQVGMAVLVAGELDDAGEVLARFVTDEQEPPPPAVVDGVVASVAESSFVVAFDPGAGDGITVTVDEATEWLGAVTGIGDLLPGMWVHVDGEYAADGSIHAFVVVVEPEPPPMPVHVMGSVESVAADGFTLATDAGAVVTIRVDDQTAWIGLGGLGDVTVGLRLLVEGEREGDGAVYAWLVATEEIPPPDHVDLLGTVSSIGASSFVLSSDGRHDGLVTVEVSADTVWGGGFTGLGDLEVGDLVHVAGTLTAGGTVAAELVEDLPEPPGGGPVILTGTVEAVGNGGFTMVADEDPGGLVQIRVGPRTVWEGGLGGLADLEPGTWVMVEGHLDPDGTVMAMLVAGNGGP